MGINHCGSRGSTRSHCCTAMSGAGKRKSPAYLPEDDDEHDGEPNSRKSRPECATDAEHRIKVILGKAETFATCTGEDILVIAIDEDGHGQHWGTGAFRRFLQDKRIQELLYQHLVDTPNQPSSVLSETSLEIEHLSALLRQKVANASPYGSTATFNNDHRPAPWPASVPFCDPRLLSHSQVLQVLKAIHLAEVAAAAEVDSKDTKRARTV